jgi:ABC-2 type transport system ATP-binding protein
MSILSFNAVSKIYRPGLGLRALTALRDVSFRIDEPGVVGFAGANGAGKTTTIKLALGLVHPTRGRVQVRGVDASHPRARLRVAFVSEQPANYGYLSIEESMRFVSRLVRRDRAREGDEIDSALHAAGLAHARTQKVRECSKGVRQRLSLAQALLGDPDVYLLDEPMSGLDPVGRRLVRELIQQQARQGAMIFFSTHVLEDIESLCDRVIALDRGRVIYDGAVNDLLDQGFLGYELTTPALPDSLARWVRDAGVAHRFGPGEQNHLFIPRDMDLEAVLRRLAAEEVYPQRLHKRRNSLGEALYRPDALKGQS